MRVALRCDASPSLGAGHWMRCLALARALKRAGAEIAFLCVRDVDELAAQSPGFESRSMYRVRRAAGLPIHWLSFGPQPDPIQDADACLAALADWPVDWLVLDRPWPQPGQSRAFCQRLRARARRLLVLDDQPQHPLDCDLLLNPNLPIQAAAYAPLVPAHCRLLLGPEYALLDESFLSLSARVRDGRVRRVLISFGGSDPPGASLLTLTALKRLDAVGALAGLSRMMLVAGPGNPDWPALREAAYGLPQLRLVPSVRAMAAQLQAADLVIGAAGGSLWERAWLGVPALVLALVPHQRPVAEALAARGAIDYLGPVESLDAAKLAERIAAALGATQRLCAIATNARALIGQARFARAPRAFLEE